MDTKHPLRSKTIWGGFLLFASYILSQIGVDLDSQTQASLLEHGLAVADHVLAIVGLLTVIWGRYTAARAIKASSSLTGLVLVGTIGSATLTGCGPLHRLVDHPPTPMQQVTAAREAYTSALEALIPLRRAGLIDDEAAMRIEAIRAEAAALLDVAQQAAQSGDDGKATTTLDRVNALLDRLIEAGAQGPRGQGAESRSRSHLTPGPLGPLTPSQTPSRKDTHHADGPAATVSHRPRLDGRGRGHHSPGRATEEREPRADGGRAGRHQGAAARRRGSLESLAAQGRRLNPWPLGPLAPRPLST